MSDEHTSDEPEYESIRRTGGEPSETIPSEATEPEYESIRKTGGDEDDGATEEAEERESGGGAV